MRLIDADAYQFPGDLVNEPTFDAVSVVHGRWAVKCESHLDQASGEFDEDYYIECSECGRKVWDISQDAALFGDWQKIFNDFPYCHCGAKMDEGKGNG